MNTERIAPLLVALVVALVPSLASAQHERFTAEDLHVARLHHDARLRDDDDVLRAPSAGDYAASIGVMALGGVAIVGGVVVGFLASYTVHPIASTPNPSLGDAMLVGSIAGAAVGAILLAVGIGSLIGLHHRAGMARRAELAGVSVSPTIDGGLSIAAWGTF